MSARDIDLPVPAPVRAPASIRLRPKLSNDLLLPLVSARRAGATQAGYGNPLPIWQQPPLTESDAALRAQLEAPDARSRRMTQSDNRDHAPRQPLCCSAPTRGKQRRPERSALPASEPRTSRTPRNWPTTTACWPTISREPVACMPDTACAQYLEAAYARAHATLHATAWRPGQRLLTLFRDDIPAGGALARLPTSSGRPPSSS